MSDGQVFAASGALAIPKQRWIAMHYKKSEMPLMSIPGIVDLHHFYIDWCVDLDDRQADGVGNLLLTMNQRTASLSAWRQQLSDAERQLLTAGTLAAVSGATTVAAGVGVIVDLLSGGLPIGSGLVALTSGVICGCNLGAAEAAAKRGDFLVGKINETAFELVEFGRQIDLPYCVPHETPIIQSACTTLARAFGAKDEAIKATQAGLASWLNADLKFVGA